MVIDNNRMSVPIAGPYLHTMNVPSGPIMKGSPLDVKTQNPKQPGGGSGFNATGLVTGGITFAGDAYNAFQYRKSADDLIQQAGRTNSSIGGIGYEMNKNIDSSKELAEVSAESTANTFKTAASGAAMGSVLGPIGAAAGGVLGGIVGLFGAGKRKREAKRRMEEAQAKITRTNNFNRDVAFTTKLQADFNQEYGNLEDQILFAKKGKDVGTTGKSMNRGIVDTAAGLAIGAANAIGHKGEPMRDRATGDAAIIKGGKGNGENAPLNVQASTEIYGTGIDPINGMTFELNAKPLVAALEHINNKIKSIKSDKSKGIAERAAAPLKEKLNSALDDMGDRQRMTRAANYTGLPEYKKGKIGWASNAIPNGLGMMAGIAQMIKAGTLKVYRPNTYVRNPYETRALAELDKLRVNPYPIEREMRNAESRMNYQLANSGGLSGSQKYLGRIANYNNLYNSIANMYSGIQQQNNAYRSAAAQAKLEAGAQDAANRAAALRADNDIYMKSHAARQAGIQTGLYNMFGFLQNYAKGEQQRKQFNWMYDLYAQDVDLRREELKNKKS